MSVEIDPLFPFLLIAFLIFLAQWILCIAQLIFSYKHPKRKNAGKVSKIIWTGGLSACLFGALAAGTVAFIGRSGYSIAISYIFFNLSSVWSFLPLYCELTTLMVKQHATMFAMPQAAIPPNIVRGACIFGCVLWTAVTITAWTTDKRIWAAIHDFYSAIFILVFLFFLERYYSRVYDLVQQHCSQVSEMTSNIRKSRTANSSRSRAISSTLNPIAEVSHNNSNNNKNDSDEDISHLSPDPIAPPPPPPPPPAPQDNDDDSNVGNDNGDPQHQSTDHNNQENKEESVPERGFFDPEPIPDFENSSDDEDANPIDRQNLESEYSETDTEEVGSTVAIEVGQPSDVIALNIKDEDVEEDNDFRSVESASSSSSSSTASSPTSSTSISPASQTREIKTAEQIAEEKEIEEALNARRSINPAAGRRNNNRTRATFGDKQYNQRKTVYFSNKKNNSKRARSSTLESDNKAMQDRQEKFARWLRISEVAICFVAIVYFMTGALRIIQNKDYITDEEESTVKLIGIYIAAVSVSSAMFKLSWRPMNLRSIG